MAAMHERGASIRFEIFTKVPEWFFQESLSGPFTYHSCLTDIGMIQKTPLREDLSKTLERLDDFLPFDGSQITGLAEEITRTGCELVICDIAPMGIVVAQEAGIPSALVENFTWDWIYEGYAGYDPRMNRHIAYLQRVFEVVDYRVQTEPVCCYGPADLTVSPVSREVRTPAQQVREKLGIPSDSKVVIVTMGGMVEQHLSLEELTGQGDAYFVILGSHSSMQIRDNLVLSPHHSGFFHPDLIHACDAVIGKVGYSTLAEVYHAGVPFGYVTRPNFRESEALAAYVEKHMKGFAITEAQFQDGSWIGRLPDLLALPRVRRTGPNGAGQVANFVCSRIT